MIRYSIAILCLLTGAHIQAQTIKTKGDTTVVIKPVRNEIENLQIVKKKVAFSITVDEKVNGTYTINTDKSEDIGTALEYKTKVFDESNRIRGSMFFVPADGVYHFNVNIEFDFNLNDWENFFQFELLLCSAPDLVLERSMYKIPKTSFVPYYNMSLNTTRALKKGTVIFTSFKPFGDDVKIPINIVRATFSGFKVGS